MNIEYYLIMVLAVIISSVSQILLKISSGKKYGSLLKEYLNSYVITAYLLLFSSTILMIVAFKAIDYKNAPVLESLGYLFILILCRLLLHEKFTKKNIAGNMLIVLGIIIFYI